jgi:hypothetical protein
MYVCMYVELRGVATGEKIVLMYEKHESLPICNVGVYVCLQKRSYVCVCMCAEKELCMRVYVCRKGVMYACVCVEKDTHVCTYAQIHT